jgi:PAS domain S-box-containing protein
MRADSVQYRVVLPAALLVFAVMAAVLGAVLYASTRVSEDYEDFLVAEHEAHVRHTVSTALGNLVSAGLLDRGDVNEAVRKGTLRELAALWERHEMSGVVVTGGKPALETIPAELLPTTLEHAGVAGVFHFYRGFRFYNGFTVTVPSWDWRIVTVSRPMAPPLLRHNNALVLWLIPFVGVSSLLLLAGILVVLDRNLKRPIATVLQGIAGKGAIPATGVREVDEIGAAITGAFAELQSGAEQLRQSEEHYRTLTEGAQDLIFEVGAGLELRYVNRYAAHFFLAEPEALAGRRLPELLPGDTGEAARRDLEAVLRDGAAATVEWSVSFPRGEVCWNTRLIPLADAAGRIASVMGIGRDLTDRRRAEQALAMEKERLAVTLRSIGDGVISCDPHGRVTLLNRVAEAILGVSQEEAAGKAFGEVLTLEDSKTARSLVYDVKHLLGLGWTEGLPRRATLLNRRQERFVLEIGGSAIRDAGSQVIGAVLVFRDVTQEQSREAEVQRAQRLESLGLLAGGIAHDFNNILTGILGNVSLAELGVKDDPKLARTLGEVEKAALRASGLTRQLLTFSRGGAPVKTIFNLETLLREAADFALHGSTVRLDFALPAGLWWVEADEGQIGQVVNNLVINAVQAMPGGGAITVSAENRLVPPGEGPLRPGRYVQVRVADTGPGIEPAHLARIFEPYFTTKATGTGLGLATSYSIIHRHGGHIDVRSTPGSGTVFTFLLPAVSPKGPQPEAEPAPLRTGQGTVLLMDDEEIIRQLGSEALASLGYGCVCVVSGDDALREYRAAREAGEPFAAVILDLTIPGGKGGKETIRLLRELDAGVRGIVSSGYSNDPVMANYRDYGFSAVLAKPFRVEDLGAALRRALG